MGGEASGTVARPSTVPGNAGADRLDVAAQLFQLLELFAVLQALRLEEPEPRLQVLVHLERHRRLRLRARELQRPSTARRRRRRLLNSRLLRGSRRSLCLDYWRRCRCRCWCRCRCRCWCGRLRHGRRRRDRRWCLPRRSRSRCGRSLSCCWCWCWGSRQHDDRGGPDEDAVVRRALKVALVLDGSVVFPDFFVEFDADPFPRRKGGAPDEAHRPVHALFAHADAHPDAHVFRHCAQRGAQRRRGRER